MTLRQSGSPYGYRELLVYKKAEALQSECARLTHSFVEGVKRDGKGGTGLKTIIALADQMDRSARSVKQNIVEGWKRNSTREYYDFLGFSIGANAELEEDCNDIVKGVYEEMGLKGGRGLDEVERLPFYPLNPRLPPLVRLKLRCKELNLLLHKLQQSLAGKMTDEHRLSLADKLNSAAQRERRNDEWLRKEREEWEERETGKRG